MSLHIDVEYREGFGGVPVHKKALLTPKYVSGCISYLLRQCGVFQGSFTATVNGRDKMAVTRCLTVSTYSKKEGELWFSYLPLNKRGMPVLDCSLTIPDSSQGELLREVMFDLSQRINKVMKEKWTRDEPKRQLQLRRISLQGQLRRYRQQKAALAQKVRDARREIEKIKREMANLKGQLTETKSLQSTSS